MSDSVRPHRQQPTRLHHPWDSPGKNTGVGCHFLLQFMKVKSEIEVSQSCPTLLDSMDCSLPGSSVHGIFQARVLKWIAITFSNNPTVVSKYSGERNNCRSLTLNQKLEMIMEKEFATRSSVPAWRIPGMVEPGGMPPMGSHRVGHD